MDSLDNDNHYLVDDTNADVDINYYRDEYVHSNIKDSDIDSSQYSDACNNFLSNTLSDISNIKHEYDDLFDELQSSESGKLLKKIAYDEGIGNYHIPIFDNWLECLIQKYIY